jgi:hypothetical protein
MEDLFDIIIPAVVMAVYFFGNLLSKKSKDGEGQEPNRNEPELTGDSEYIRRVRDEIRRKVEARRNDPPESERREQYPVEPALGRRKSTSEHVHQRRQRTSAPVPQPEVIAPTQNAYQNQMKARLAKLKKTQREAAALRDQALKNASSKTQKQSAVVRTKRFGLNGPVRANLKDVGAARTAFIYGEVLGSPVGLRKDTSNSVPGLAK